MKPCPACDGRGGFNRFMEIPAGGTATHTIHQWIPCSHCAGTGGVVDPRKEAGPQKFTGVLPGMEQK